MRVAAWETVCHVTSAKHPPPRQSYGIQILNMENGFFSFLLTKLWPWPPWPWPLWPRARDKCHQSPPSLPPLPWGTEGTPGNAHLLT